MHQITYKYGKLNFYSKDESDKYFVDMKSPTKDPKTVYQEYINDMFVKYHRPNSIVLDIGANIGIFTVSFATLDKSCSVYSFEPISDIYKYLESNVQVNNLDNVKLFNLGISDKNEKLNIKFLTENWGGSSITQNFDSDKYKNIEINTVTLDSLNLKNISFIKVDVQDHEIFVLQGAKKTLMENDIFIILELTNKSENDKILYNKCIELMNSYGYTYKKKIGAKDYIFNKHNVF